MMAVIIEFPRKKKLPRINNTPRKRGMYWHMADLGGHRPTGHPTLKRGPRGKVLLELGQVWVEPHNDELWVIDEIKKVRDAFYPHDVLLIRYQGCVVRKIAESSLRSGFQVWDDAIASRKVIMAKLARAGASPAFFGLNKNGDRID